MTTLTLFSGQRLKDVKTSAIGGYTVAVATSLRRKDCNLTKYDLLNSGSRTVRQPNSKLFKIFISAATGCVEGATLLSKFSSMTELIDAEFNACAPFAESDIDALRTWVPIAPPSDGFIFFACGSAWKKLWIVLVLALILLAPKLERETVQALIWDTVIRQLNRTCIRRMIASLSVFGVQWKIIIWHEAWSTASNFSGQRSQHKFEFEPKPNLRTLFRSPNQCWNCKKCWWSCQAQQMQQHEIELPSPLKSFVFALTTSSRQSNKQIEAKIANEWNDPLVM